MSFEVDFHENITDLYNAITESNWEEAMRAVKKNPDEAKTWVVRKHEDDPTKNMWRFLPIHSACARQPPAGLIKALLAAYPTGARSVDDQGMYALHYAAGNQASREVIRALLMAFPDAAKLTDPRGMLPIHYIACWGPSSISVVDMILVANRNISDCKDEDGNTPSDLAKEGDYRERNAVVAALKRWSTSSSSEHQRSTSSQSSITPSYKVIGSNFRSLHISEERKTDDSLDSLTRCSSPGTTGKLREMDDHISVMEIEKKEDKLEISMLQYEVKQRNDMIEKLKETLSQMTDECNGLRKTLADVTEQHDGLASMNSSLLSMVEQQEIVLKATRAREEQWEELAKVRREKLKEIVQMEDQDTFHEVDLRNVLAQQDRKMAAIKATISATLEA
ncbi:unnamed protein product [Pseudo-nitzschia multistriata]|uniref:Uncharacterized protein n=1 Tax=Pseudo-nitzschia multistriata TaxID=183589 RepID=A0A448ZII3_9STRA|nr:unnamed protein product [Pseudo-nitzschia multistriata]